MAEEIKGTEEYADHAPRNHAPQTVDDLNAAGIGGQVVPLLKGLTQSYGDSFGNEFHTLKPLKTRMLLGSPIQRSGSFTRRLAVRPGFVDNSLMSSRVTQPAALSRLTNALNEVHDQLRRLGQNLTKLIDESALPPETVRYMHSFEPPIVGIDNRGTYVYARPCVPADQRAEHYAEALAASLATDRLPVVTLKFKIDGRDQSIPIDNGSISIGKKGERSLAQVLFALGLVGDLLGLRSQDERRFILDFAGGSAHELPPVQARVCDYLAQQLSDKGYENPKKILGDSECDLNRKTLRTALESLLPYAEIYATACKLRGESQPDYFMRALEKIKSLTGKCVSDPTCQDGYECAILLEGMLDYAIDHSQEKDRRALSMLRDQYAAECKKVLGMEDGFTSDIPTVDQIMTLPEAQKIIQVFSAALSRDHTGRADDCAAAILQSDQALAEHAWGIKLRSEKSGHTPSRK